MKEVTVYSDGSCKGNPGPGGWCCILVYRGHEKVLSGGDPVTTNNRMEMTAVIKALEALKEPCRVTLVSDSKYVIDALSLGWAEKWKSRGWKRSSGDDALNPDLWDMLLALTKKHTLTYKWVKGHAGHEYNERCDAIAQNEADNAH
ncbi:MAG: ribonuclease HI [Firmicutes bacterium]|nr:ribonuclease HI [Bacillota bacterium]MCD7783913.1 ribonuclease HI [Bacillota bacterium]